MSMYFSVFIIKYDYYFTAFSIGSGRWPPFPPTLNALCNLKKKNYNMMVTLVMMKTKQNMVMLFLLFIKPPNLQR